ncbi:MAG: competence protein CoiA family protein [Limisphaerales bacterium]
MNPTQPKLGVAFRDDQLVAISEVESGLGCGCVCPACGAQLVARKGQIRLHHFAHHNTAPCEYGVEMIAHLLAKWILEQSMAFTVPPVYAMPGTCLRPYQDRLLAEVQIERRFGGIVPDILARDKDGNSLVIHIRVTHPADQRKIHQLGELGLSAVEVRVPKCDVLSVEQMQKVMTTTTGTKVWLFNMEAAAHRVEHFGSPDGPGRNYELKENYYGYFPGGLTCGTQPYSRASKTVSADS